MNDPMLSDMQDVCVRMQEAWRIRATIQLSIVDSIPGGYIGVCVTRFDTGLGFPIKLVRRLPRERKINTLAHELRHVMQRMEGRLRGSLEHDTCMWDGVRVPLPTPMTREAYNLLPWEADANTWADTHAPAFYATRTTFIPVTRSFDIPWGK